MSRLEGKVAVVTGAGNGLGRAHAIALAAAGAKVLVNDVGRALVGGRGGRGLEYTPPDLTMAEAVVAEIADAGGVAVANVADVATVDGAASVVEAALEAFGDVHVVVNNAGTIHAADVDDVDDARLDGDFSVNVKGTAGTTKAAFSAMKQRGHGGSIVNTITRFGGFPEGTGLTAYTAAKYAVVAYTLSAAGVGRSLGIRVNAFSPLALTRQSQGWFHDRGFVDPADAETAKHLTAEQMSPFVIFLASDASLDLTGRLFMIVPTSLDHRAQFVIKEAFVVETDGTSAASWTVDEIERRSSSFMRSESRQGGWSATIAAPGV